jgi:putative hydrolase of the HAD superfamily
MEIPMTATRITTIFTDVGGVLLTNGWDRGARKLACSTFSLDYEEMNERHHLTFDTYEEGKLTLDQYLDRVIFYESQPFTRDEFRSFMFARSQPLPGMVDLLREVKSRYGLRVAAVSNEGRELMQHRIDTFALGEVIDFFIVSAYVHFRKPDADIFNVALDIAQAKVGEVVYLEDRQMFVDIASEIGLRAIHHTDIGRTREALAELGLEV